MEDDGKFCGEYKNRRFLGHLSLEALYSMLMDLVNASTIMIVDSGNIWIDGL